MNITITRINAAALALLLALGWTFESAPAAQQPETTIDNNQPFRNPSDMPRPSARRASSI